MTNIIENIREAAKKIGPIVHGQPTLQLCPDMGMPSGNPSAGSTIFERRDRLPRQQVLHMSDDKDREPNRDSIIHELWGIGDRLYQLGHDPYKLIGEYENNSGRTHKTHGILFLSGFLEFLKGLFPHEDDQS